MKNVVIALVIIALNIVLLLVVSLLTTIDTSFEVVAYVGTVLTSCCSIWIAFEVIGVEAFKRKETNCGQ